MTKTIEVLENVSKYLAENTPDGDCHEWVWNWYRTTQQEISAELSRQKGLTGV